MPYYSQKLSSHEHLRIYSITNQSEECKNTRLQNKRVDTYIQHVVSLSKDTKLPRVNVAMFLHG